MKRRRKGVAACCCDVFSHEPVLDAALSGRLVRGPQPCRAKSVKSFSSVPVLPFFVFVFVSGRNSDW